MHEYAATEELVALVAREAGSHGLSAVKKVTAELGALTTFKAEAIQFYFEVYRKELPLLFAAELILQEQAGMAKCSSCNSEFQVEDPLMIRCPRCPDAPVQIVAGQDFRVKTIEGD